MDVMICSKCQKSNPSYAQFCEDCNSNLINQNKNNDDKSEKTTMFQSAYANDESTKSKTLDSVLIGIVGFLTVWFGGILWLIIAGAIYFPFRSRNNSWIYFIIPWVLLQIVGFVIFQR